MTRSVHAPGGLCDLVKHVTHTAEQNTDHEADERSTSPERHLRHHAVRTAVPGAFASVGTMETICCSRSP